MCSKLIPLSAVVCLIVAPLGLFISHSQRRRELLPLECFFIYYCAVRAPFFGTGALFCAGRAVLYTGSGFFTLVCKGAPPFIVFFGLFDKTFFAFHVLKLLCKGFSVSFGYLPIGSASQTSMRPESKKYLPFIHFFLLQCFCQSRLLRAPVFLLFP